MKKIITLSLLLALFSNMSFSQIIIKNLPAVNTDYLQKSKRQKTAAWILLGAGGTLMVTGVIIPRGGLIHESLFQKTYKNDGIKSTLTSTGIVAILGSIPLFIASSKNKRKAANLSFKNETVPGFYKQSIVSQPAPSLTIKICL